MARNNDAGPYAVGNVEIVEVSKNMLEQLNSGKHVFRKLSSQQMLEICGKVDQGMSTVAVADLYGISQSHVSRIVNGKRGKLILLDKITEYGTIKYIESQRSEK